MNFLLGMGGLILLIAWVNYINLSSAKALERVRDIGVRKAIGASHLALFCQFLLQAFLSNAAALLGAIGMIALSVSLYLGEVTDGVIDFSLFGNLSFWLVAVAMGMAGSVLSGTYPALLLSAYRPVEALRGRVQSAGSGLMLRRVLVTGQFAASVTLAIGVACLGLIGLTAFAIAGKMKEIGVRKVHGASTAQVAGLLVKDVPRTVLLAGLLAYGVSTGWLGHYAFRIPLSWVYFVASAVAVTAIALLSILYQTLKAVRTTPAAFLHDK